MTSLQAPASVVMVRPHRFRANEETAADNAFQTGGPADAARAYAEVTAVACGLSRAGVRVHLFEDEGPEDTPDSLFPNNWFSTHADGLVGLYPMAAGNRRRERRPDVLDLLRRHYDVRRVVDYSGLEHQGVFLEGTGALVLDHVASVAYVVRSNRAHEAAVARFAADFGYEPVVFDARGPDGGPIFHTNIMLCVGERFALAGLDCVPDAASRAGLRARLMAGGRDLILLTPPQIAAFAGNAIELAGDARVLALSARALAALTDDQRASLARHVRLVPFAVPTIEQAGGSVRCMIAGIHLTPRSERIMRVVEPRGIEPLTS